MKRRICLLAAFPFLLAACAGDEAPDTQMADTPSPEGPPAAEPMDGGMAGGMDGMATTVAMSPLGNSGVSGEAILTPAGNQTEVSVTLNGLEPNTTHPGHIHQGSCDAPGSVVVPLSEITADASGAGTMTTTASVAPNTWMAGGHIVAYHGEGGAPIVCGDIEGHRM